MELKRPHRLRQHHWECAHARDKDPPSCSALWRDKYCAIGRFHPITSLCPSLTDSYDGALKPRQSAALRR